MKTAVRLATGVAGLALAAGGVWASGGAGNAAPGHADIPTSSDVVARSALPTCTAADLSVHYRGTDAAMSHRFGHLVLTNISDQTCRTGGYVGLSYVGHGDGSQIGAAATRDGSVNRPRPLVIEPGGHARAQVSRAVAQVYPKGRCHPTHVDGFRVYVPNSRAASYVPFRTVGCANPHIELLSTRPLT